MTWLYLFSIEALEWSPLNFANAVWDVAYLAIFMFGVGCGVAMYRAKPAAIGLFLSLALMMVVVKDNHMLYFDIAPDGALRISGSTNPVVTLLTALVAVAWLLASVRTYLQRQRPLLDRLFIGEFYGSLSMATLMIASQMWYGFASNLLLVNVFNAISQWMLLLSLGSLVVSGVLRYKQRQSAPVKSTTTRALAA